MKKLLFAVALATLAIAPASFAWILRFTPTTVELPVGQEADIRGFWDLSGFSLPLGPPPLLNLVSFDPDVLAVQLTQLTPYEFKLHVRALSVGRATIGERKGFHDWNTGRDYDWPYYGVTTIDCSIVSIRPDAPVVLAQLHHLVGLHVTTTGYEPNYVDWAVQGQDGTWGHAPSGGSDVMYFNPPVAGTYHVRAEYMDRCGIADAFIDVIVAAPTSKSRAVRH